MAQDRAPQLHLLSYEPRGKAFRGGLRVLFRRNPPQTSLFASSNGADGNHQAPHFQLLSYESRGKSFGGHLRILLRKDPPLTSLFLGSNGSNGAGGDHQAPRFHLLTHEPRRKAFKGGLPLLFRKNPPPQPLIVGRDEVLTENRPKFTALFSSSLLHFSILLFLLEVPLWLLLPHSQTQTTNLPQIVYKFQEIELPPMLPAVKPPGPGGKPGKGTHPEKAPARGSTAFHRKVTVVSNPPHPDNDFQTIIQPKVRAAKTISIRLRLPNIVMGGALTVPAPPPKVPPPPMKLSLPKDLNSLTIPKTTLISLKAPSLHIPASTTPNMPAIPAPPPPAPPKPEPQAKAPKVFVATLGIQAISNGTNAQLLSLSLNPAPPTKKLVLPAGNRYGAFTVSPSGNHPGSPNGTGNSSGGVGGPGSGGDASTGVGYGHAGGGGGGTGSSKLAVSTSGNAAGAGAANGGRLSASYLAKLVYPLLRPPPKNRFAMVITAGPVGGGGLHIFGVLKGGKVYTVFLPMPGGNWILQYCALNGKANGQNAQKTGITLKFNFGLVPPAVEKRYNFHRPGLSPEQKKKMIVLHGIIGADGSVRGLTVYRGVQNVANQAAVAAFSKWKFQPALRNNKPIPIEILLGIPLS